jgi:hypothetical protein
MSEVQRENSVEVGAVKGSWKIAGDKVVSMMRFGLPPWAWEIQRGRFRVMAIEDERVETYRWSDQVRFRAGIMMMEDLQNWSARYGLVMFKLESAAPIDMPSAYGTVSQSFVPVDQTRGTREKVPFCVRSSQLNR